MTISGDLRRLELSGCPNGRPLELTASVQTVHTTTLAESSDAVFVELFNTTGSDVTVDLVIVPASSDPGDVTAATIPVVVRANEQRFVLDGHEVRGGGTIPYLIGASASVASGVFVVGYAIRRYGVELTP